MTMTLGQVRDEILPHVDGIGSYAHVPIVDLQEWADAITAHLSQPAQAVDVGAYKALLAEAREHHLACIKDAYRLLGIDGSDGEYRYKWVALEIVKLTRALSTAQAEVRGVEGLNERCQKVMRNRGKPYPRTCYVCGWAGPCVTSDAQLAQVKPLPALPAHPAPDKEG